MMDLVETDLNITKIEEKLKKLQDEHLSLMKSQNLATQLENETSNSCQPNNNLNNIHNNSTINNSCSSNNSNTNSSSSSMSMNSPDKMFDEKWNLEDEYYQLKIGSKNGEINYKNLFRFNKINDDLLTKDNEYSDDFKPRSNENTNSTDLTYKSPILLKYSSYYNKDSLCDYENKFKYNDNKYDFLNDSNKINNNDLSCDRSFNMSNDIYKKYQESKKLSNEIISTLNQAKIFEINSLINDNSNLNSDLNKLNINEESLNNQENEKLEIIYKPRESAFDSDPDLIKLNNDRKDFVNPLKSSIITYSNHKQVQDSDDKKNHYFDYDSNPSNNINQKDISTSSLSISNSSGSKEYFKSTYLNDQNNDLKEDETKARKSKYDKIEDKIYENPYKSYKEELDNANNKYDKILDSEFLKVMDKKLKKLMKTNFCKEEINSDSISSYKSNNNGGKINPISWNISPNKYEKTRMNGGEHNTINIDDSICSSFITNQHLSHPYLPLRDVPMHDLVKKLQREFESEEAEVNGLPAEYKSLWEKLKNDYCSNKNGLAGISKEDLNRLKSYFKNPIKEVINKISDEEVSEFINLIETSKKMKNNKKTELPTVIPNNHFKEPKYKLKDMNLISEHNDIRENIKDMIRKQKDKHEKKLRILEKLTNLENLQLDKLNSAFINEELILNKKDIQNNRVQKHDNSYNDKSNNRLSNEEEMLMNLINNSHEEMTNYKMKLIANDCCNNKDMTRDFISRVPSIWCQKPKLVNLNEEDEISVINESDYESKLDVTTLVEEEKTANNRLSKANINDQSISLQDAFKMHKQELIYRSNQRLKDIKLRSEREKLKTELRNNKLIQIDELNKKKLNDEKFKKKYDYMQIYFKPEEKKPNFTRRRHMSTKEIKSQTKKLYKKLPEVKQKELDKKMEEIKKHNRIKSAMFKKMIQQKVLINGPNFNLSFRALESSIQ